MAFPVPNHLPRKATPQDISSKILTKIDDATNQSLNAALANTWVTELDETIRLTKTRIHERIHADLPEFERQMSSAQSVQTRLQSLTTHVDNLSDALSNAQSGLVPTLVRSLTAHSALAQDATDATVRHEALSHFLQCASELKALSASVDEGKLAEAIEKCRTLEELLAEMPPALSQSKVAGGLKHHFRAAKDRTEEQLSDAFMRSVVASPSELVIRPDIQVRQSRAVISLPSILASLSPSSLGSHLTALRRDLTSRYIEHVLKNSADVTDRTEPDHLDTPSPRTLVLFHSPPSQNDLGARLDNLAKILSFLSANLFHALPSSQRHVFPSSLCRPVTAALLAHLLVPALPSELSELPPFLDLVKRAVAFEEECVIGILGGSPEGREVESWAKGVSSHYEKKRRTDILEAARTIILGAEVQNGQATFRADAGPEKEAEVVPVQEATPSKAEEDSWGFDDGGEGSGDANGWGFDDDAPPAPESEVTTASQEPKLESEPSDDPSDAWGWNDDDAPPDEPTPAEDVEPDDAWDDPWGDDPKPKEAPAPLAPVTSQKRATRLERLSSKGKHKTNGVHREPESGPERTPAVSIPPPAAAPVKLADKKPPELTVRPARPAPIETYLVSMRTREIADAVQSAMRESREYRASNMFPSSSLASTPGSVLLQAALSVLDLYRALYPVKFSADLGRSSARAMRFSNDCLYLSDEMGKTLKSADDAASSKDLLGESAHKLKILGESWFVDTVEAERQAVNDILDGAEGFTNTGDQEQFDEYEGLVNQTLVRIRLTAQQWKDVITSSKYYSAVGQVVEAALSRVTSDILALPDIPEVESHRLSDLCKILNALEGLFINDPNEPSFVVAYVPSWLKYSYLSELLGASMADVSYLFETGALVDFDVEELVKLVRALFADTEKRTKTINKIMAGHPVVN